MRAFKSNFHILRRSYTVGDPEMQHFNPALRAKTHTITISDGRFDTELGQTQNAVMGLDGGQIDSDSVNAVLDTCRALKKRGTTGRLIMRRADARFGVRIIVDIARAATGAGKGIARRRSEIASPRSHSNRRNAARPRNRA
jgi:hypothetical protein